MEETKSTAASVDSLGELHSGVAKALKVMIEPGENGYDKGALALAIGFLKANNITASASKNEELAALSQAVKERRARRESRKGLEAAARELGDGLMRDMGIPIQ